ncbi:MAG: S8 family peptidase [Actinobacteria bacterium]|nr:S8 family peptidase [Actinomycetota bacterium]
MTWRMRWLAALLVVPVWTVHAPTTSSASAAPGIPDVAFGQATDSGSQFIVQFRSEAALDAAAALLDQRGQPANDTFDAGINALTIDADNPELARLARSPQVVSVEPDRTYSVGAVTSWGLDRIDQRSLPLNNTYNHSTSGSGVTAYIIDTGLNLTHQEFTGRVPRAAHAASLPDSVDCNGHGTHVAGTIGGTTYGVAPLVSIVPLRVFGCTGSASGSDILAALSYVVTDHLPGVPAVLNMSLGGAASAILDDAVNSVVADGVTVVVAAGNDGADACGDSPARTPNAITVGASTSADARASFSNFGTCLDLFAPGDLITSAFWTSDTAAAVISGTSMASPHVAGAAALYLQTRPTATPAAVASAVLSAATTALPTNRLIGDPARLLYVGPVTLDVSRAGGGTGAVTSDVGGINCGAACSTALTHGTSVTLTATPVGTSTFSGWSVGGCGPTPTCTIVMDGSTTVTATFGLPPRLLTVAVSGLGTVTSDVGGVNCGTTCNTTVSHGTIVTLTATPHPGAQFTGWSGGGCGAAPTCAVTVTGDQSVTATFAPVFQSFAEPVRLFDTRPSNVGVLETSADEATRFAPGEVRRYVPGPAVGAPSDAVLAVNVVAVNPGANGYLQVFPCASTATTPPAASFLNYAAGVTVANNGTVAIDGSGGICVFSSQSANVIVDTTGYLPAGSFTALAEPVRLIDSRGGQLGALERPGGTVGADISVPLVGGVPWRFVVTGANGIPTSVAALAMNITAVNPAGGGFMTVYPCASDATAPPSASTLNYRAGGAIANGAIVATNTDGGICVLSSQSAHVILDTTGYFPTTRFTALAAPVRLVDSRAGQTGALEQPGGTVGADISVPLAANTPWRFIVTGANGIPATVKGLALNLVAVGPAGGGFITVYPCASEAGAVPASSTINYRPGGTIANGAIVAPSADGGICVLSSQTTHVIIDTTGYFPA